jgi:hypothetical protein
MQISVCVARSLNSRKPYSEKGSPPDPNERTLLNPFSHSACLDSGLKIRTWKNMNQRKFNNSRLQHATLKNTFYKTTQTTKL